MDRSGQMSFKVVLIENGEIDELRRFIISEDEGTNFALLLQKIKTTFPKLERADFAVYWIDDESDEIRIVGDEELKIALTSMPSELKILYVRFQSGSDQNSEYVEVLHSKIICDNCDSEVRGFRYKCLNCTDYDLCEKCEARHFHPQHVMLRLPESMPILRNDKFWKKIHILSSYFVKPNHSRHHERPAHSHSSSHAENHHACKGKRGKGKHHKYCSNGHEAESDNEDCGCQKEKKLRKADYVSVSKIVSDFIENCDLILFPKTSGTKCQAGTSSGDVNEYRCSYLREIGNVLSSFINPAAPSKEKTSKPTDGEQSSSVNGDATPQTDVPEKTPSESNDGETLDSILKKLSEQSISDENVESRREIPIETEGKEKPKEKTTSENEKPNDKEPQNGTERLYPSVPIDPAVAVALSQMLSMGFSNEGNWLLNLLQSNDGDIVKVLELLERVKK